MSGTSFLLDTNVVLYLLAGDVRLSDLLFESILVVSVITEMELLSFKAAGYPLRSLAHT
jgi:predicted nucleic acid-binding protein